MKKFTVCILATLGIFTDANGAIAQTPATNLTSLGVATIAEAALAFGNAGIDKWTEGTAALDRLRQSSQAGPLVETQSRLQQDLIARQRRYNSELFGSALVVENTRFAGTVLFSPVPVAGPLVGNLAGAYVGNVIIKDNLAKAQARFDNDVISLARESNEAAVREFFRTGDRAKLKDAASRLATSTTDTLSRVLRTSSLSDDARERLISEILSRNFAAISQARGTRPPARRESSQTVGKRVENFVVESVNAMADMKESLKQEVDAAHSGFRYRDLIQKALWDELDRAQADPQTRRETEMLVKAFSEGMTLEQQRQLILSKRLDRALGANIDTVLNDIETLRNYERVGKFMDTFAGTVNLAGRLGDIANLPPDQRRELSNLANNVTAAQKAFSFYGNFLAPFAAGLNGPAGYLSMANAALDLLGGGGGLGLPQQDPQTARDFQNIRDQLKEISKKLDAIISTQQQILTKLDQLDYRIAAFQRELNARIDMILANQRQSAERDRFIDTAGISECRRAVWPNNQNSDSFSSNGSPLRHDYAVYKTMFDATFDRRAFVACIRTLTVGLDQLSFNTHSVLLPPIFRLKTDDQVQNSIMSAFADYYHAAVLPAASTNPGSRDVHFCFRRAFFAAARSRVFLFESTLDTRIDCESSVNRDGRAYADSPVFNFYELPTDNAAIKSVVGQVLQVGEWLTAMPVSAVRSKQEQDLRLFTPDDLDRLRGNNEQREDSAWRSVMNDPLDRLEEIIEIAAARQGVLSGIHLADWGAHVLLQELGSEKSKAPERVTAYLNMLQDAWPNLRAKFNLPVSVSGQQTMVARVAFGADFAADDADVDRRSETDGRFQVPAPAILAVLNDAETDARLRPPQAPTDEEKKYLRDLDWLFTVDVTKDFLIPNICRVKSSEIGEPRRSDRQAFRGADANNRYRYVNRLNETMNSASSKLQYPILTCLMTVNPVFARNVVRRYAYLRAATPDSKLGLNAYRSGVASWDGYGLKGVFAPAANLALANIDEGAASGWVMKIRSADGSWLRVPLPTAEEVAGGRYVFTSAFVALDDLRNEVSNHRILHGTPAIEVFGAINSAPSAPGRGGTRQPTPQERAAQQATLNRATNSGILAALALIPRMEQPQPEGGNR